MYNNKYMNLREACNYLGIGRSTALRLCQNQTAGFPAVKIGNRYQIDADMLETWKRDWYQGKFKI